MISLYETENASVIALLDEYKGFYVVQLIGEVHRKHYRNAWEAILIDAKQNEVTNIIFNYKDMTTQPDAGRVWFSNEFLPRLTKIHPNIQIAVISPAISILEQTFIPIFYFLRNFMLKFSKHKTNIKVKFFKKVPQAYAWFEGDILPDNHKSQKTENLFSQYQNELFAEKQQQNNTHKKNKNKRGEEEKPKNNFFENSLFGNIENEFLDNENRKKAKKSQNQKGKTTKNQKITQKNQTESPEKKGFFARIFSNIFFTTENQDGKKIFNIGNKKTGFSFKIHFSKKGDLGK